MVGVRNKQKMEGLIRDLSVVANIQIAHLDLEEADDLLARDVSCAFNIFGGVDVLVNCAGMGFRGRIEDTTSETDRRIMQVDYFGQVIVVKTLLKLWKSSGAVRGDIIQISSVQAFFGLGDRGPYSAAKHAMTGFIDTLRVETDSYPSNSYFRVINALPGYIATNHSTNALVADGSTYNKSDPSTIGGYDPHYVASEILMRASQGDREIIIAPMKVKILIILRSLSPSLCFRLIRNMFLKKRENLVSTLIRWLFNVS